MTSPACKHIGNTVTATQRNQGGGSCRQGWRRIMEAVAADAHSAARTVFDILNEPDVHELRWEAHSNGTGHRLPSVADVYHQIMAIGHRINPGALLTPQM